MIRVKSRGSESGEQLLKRFKKACEKEGLIREMKKHAFYEKPSIKKTRRDRQSRKRRLQGQRSSVVGF